MRRVLGLLLVCCLIISSAFGCTSLTSLPASCDGLASLSAENSARDCDIFEDSQEGLDCAEDVLCRFLELTVQQIDAGCAPGEDTDELRQTAIDRFAEHGCSTR